MLSPMQIPYLVIDMRRLLDESEAGRAAAATLEARFKDAQARHQGLRDQAKIAAGPAQKKLLEEASAFEATALADLGAARARLRDALLARANPILKRLCEERGTHLVLERSAVVLFDGAADVTAQVIEEVDAGGPLGAT